MAVAQKIKLTKIVSMFKTLLIPVVLMVGIESTLATSIAKCQDAEGNWHYGDYAAQECADSAVTELREDGVKVRVLAPPPTPEEVAAARKERQRRQAEKLAYEQRRRIDLRLLAKYPSEQDIHDIWENRRNELNHQITYNQQNLAKLQNRVKQTPEPKTETQEQKLHELVQMRDRYLRALEQGQLALKNSEQEYLKLLERYRQIDQ